MRTPEDFVNEKVSCGLQWWEILSVSRMIRGGIWRDKVQAILIQMGIMPSSPEEIKAVQDRIRQKYMENR